MRLANESQAYHLANHLRAAAATYERSMGMVGPGGVRADFERSYAECISWAEALEADGADASLPA